MHSMTYHMNANPSPFSIQARFVVPVDSPPIPDGVVTIDGSRIVSVGKDRSSDTFDLGNVAMLPGLASMAQSPRPVVR